MKLRNLRCVRICEDTFYNLISDKWYSPHGLMVKTLREGGLRTVYTMDAEGYYLKHLAMLTVFELLKTVEIALKIVFELKIKGTRRFHFSNRCCSHRIL